MGGGSWRVGSTARKPAGWLHEWITHAWRVDPVTGSTAGGVMAFYAAVAVGCGAWRTAVRCEGAGGLSNFEWCVVQGSCSCHSD